MGTDRSRRRLETNALSLLISRVLAAVATTAVFSIAAHQLSVTDFGLVASTLAAGFLANTLVTFGTDTLITRQIAADDPHARSTTAASLRLQLISTAALIATSAIAWLLGAPYVLIVQAVALVPQAVVTVAGAVLRGRQHMVPLATASVVGAIASLAATIAGFALTTAPVVPIVGLATGSVITAITLAVAVRRSEPEPHRAASSTGNEPLGQLLRRTAPFAVMVVLAAAGAQGGLLLVEFATDEPTGGYGAAIRLTEAGRLVPAAVIGAFFPAMVGGAHRSLRYRQWMRILAGYSLAATTALVAGADMINRVFFDSQPDGAALIRILAVSLIFTLARLALSFEAIAEGRERRVVVSALIGTAVLIVAGLFFASLWGARGVAIAHVAGVAAAGFHLALARLRSSGSMPPPGSSVGVREPTAGNG